METKFTHFLRAGGNGEFLIRREANGWSGGRTSFAIKSEFPGYAALRDSFAAKLDAIIQTNTAMLLQVIGPQYDPPLTATELPDISAARADTLALWEERIEVIWTEWHSHLQRLRPIREAMEQHLLRGFAGLINELRQRGLGIRQYVWRSRDDGKVRSSHAHYDDQVFSWDDPPEGGHPGQEFNCRCHAEPYVADAATYTVEDPISFIASFINQHEPGFSVGQGVRPRDGLLDYFLPPEPGITVNGVMLNVQTQGNLATAFENIDAAIKENPQALLDIMALRGSDFSKLAQVFGRSSPGNFLTAALLAAAGAPEAQIDGALTSTRGVIDRLVGGYATALVDAANTIRSMPDLRWSDIAMVAQQIYDDPSILPQSMAAPYRERIAVGDYAGALGYGLPEVIAGLAGLARLRLRAAELPGPMPITREMLDASGRIEGIRNAGRYAPHFDKWIDKGGQVHMTPEGDFFYTKELNVLGVRQDVTVLYREGSPDFAPFMTHPSGVRSVEIEMTGGNAADVRRANAAAGHPEWGSRPPTGWSWHHVEDGRTMQLVPSVINDEFGHEGGASLARRSEN
jgi:SPP1 gp7 family putative phage head morphogenesis protein